MDEPDGLAVGGADEDGFRGEDAPPPPHLVAGGVPGSRWSARGHRDRPGLSHTVRLVLVDATGRTLGAPPDFDVPVPWWQDAAAVVAGARAAYDVEVTVLRLLADDPATPALLAADDEGRKLRSSPASSRPGGPSTPTTCRRTWRGRAPNPADRRRR